MVPDTVNPKEGQAFELSPLVEQPQSPNGHPSLQPAQYECKENPNHGTSVITVQHLQPSLYERNENTTDDTSVSTVQHLQPALYEHNENTTDGNSTKSFDLASVA